MTTQKASSTNGAAAPISHEYVGALNMALDVVSTRVLALIAELGAVAMWGFTIYDPTRDRIWAALGYSATVLIPLVILHWRKG